MEDPRASAVSYLESKKIPQLLENVTSQLLFFKPDNPKEFIVKYLEGIKSNGTQPLITERDLDTMFGMFDITKRGTVTVEQANRALQVILGPAADLATASHVKPGTELTRQDFIQAMTTALEQATPYKV